MSSSPSLYLSSKQSILNRPKKPPSKANVSNREYEYMKEQRRLEMLRNKANQTRLRRARELYGTRTERTEIRDQQLNDMAFWKTQKQKRVQAERDYDLKKHMEAEQQRMETEELHKKRDSAKRAYLAHIASQNRQVSYRSV
mmetsp:Transcript_2466/g.4556  ORF Transcript_2466/g.4556 Transcript_2466/m.4556 type:complete len:141 (-) Transcript_2466:3037-3459(-)